MYPPGYWELVLIKIGVLAAVGLIVYGLIWLIAN